MWPSSLDLRQNHRNCKFSLIALKLHDHVTLVSTGEVGDDPYLKMIGGDMVKLASFVLHIEIDYFVHVTYFSRELVKGKKETCDLYYTGLFCVCVFGTKHDHRN